jgi:hypothetical protein
VNPRNSHRTLRIHNLNPIDDNEREPSRGSIVIDHRTRHTNETNND